MGDREFTVGHLGEAATQWAAKRAAGDVQPAVPRRAATVMLVRDGTPSDGVEVFMIRRVASMAFAPRMWVFPGGGVDPRDDDADLPWAGPPPTEWAQRLGCSEEPEGGVGLARALVAAAVREVFEECGVLLAGPTAETVVADLRDPEWDRERAGLLAHEHSLTQMLQRRGLVLRSDLLNARARWVTPEFEPRRYDTYFFSALLPDGQIPDDATTEADVAGWTVPGELLAQVESGQARMMPPTRVSVEQVAAAESASGFLAETGDMRPVRPRLVEVDGGYALRTTLP